MLIIRGGGGKEAIEEFFGGGFRIVIPPNLVTIGIFKGDYPILVTSFQIGLVEELRVATPLLRQLILAFWAQNISSLFNRLAKSFSSLEIILATESSKGRDLSLLIIGFTLGNLAIDIAKSMGTPFLENGRKIAKVCFNFTNSIIRKSILPTFFNKINTIRVWDPHPFKYKGTGMKFLRIKQKNRVLKSSHYKNFHLLIGEVLNPLRVHHTSIKPFFYVAMVM